ncbi:glycosyltransferase family 4 protein [Caenispirillum bisanense]|uniref:glycosyltransferase family 4 protein n=1 Tax=Caenispirillum bisanense TaxID=414052 RepID=UPI0031E1CFA1
MNILMVHQNFPGQFKNLVNYFSTLENHRVVFLTQGGATEPPGIERIVYRPRRAPAAGTHPYLLSTEKGVLAAQEVARQCLILKKNGFSPDIMIGHNGWGELLFLKDIWPHTPLVGYFEFFYNPLGYDMGFDPEFQPTMDDVLRSRVRNSINLLGLAAADAGIAPTEWQRSVHPSIWHDKITVLHEGIDTKKVFPSPDASIVLGRENLRLTRHDEIITFSVRNLEPYRGFHVFMRALPIIQHRRPRARVIFVGGDDVSYGRKRSDGLTWRQALTQEIKDVVDINRIHFLGHLPYEHYLRVLQVSQVHVYLTYPFVLSWSLLEAMSAGCAIVGSATPPVQEVIADGSNGLLVDFFDREGLADRIDHILDHPTRRADLRAAARSTIVDRFDLHTKALPAYLNFLQRWADRS